MDESQSAAVPSTGQQAERLERVSLESAMLCNAVTAVDGLLYIHGGGWTSMTLPFQTAAMGFRPVHGAVLVAAVILVPWTCTNERHEIALSVVDADGRVYSDPLSMELVLGRPSNLPIGTAQRVCPGISLNGHFYYPGQYAVRITVDGEEDRRLPFTIRAA